MHFTTIFNYYLADGRLWLEAKSVVEFNVGGR